LAVVDLRRDRRRKLETTWTESATPPSPVRCILYSY
jgi:hypothetical protein